MSHLGSTDSVDCGGGFGVGSLGSIGFGSEAPSVELAIVQLSLNSVRVTLDGAFVGSDPIAIDPLDASAWSLALIDPAIPGARLPLVQALVRVSDTTVDVFFDAPLTPGQGYALSYEGGGECASFASFVGFAPANRSIPDRSDRVRGRFDLANPSYEADAAGNVTSLGTLQVDSTGDYANETGIPYLRKRIVRRLTTTLGGFTFLPEYGFGVEIGRILRPSSQFRLRALAERQVREEPDVARASVSLTQPRPGVVVFRVRVTTSAGVVDQFDEQMTIGG